MKSLEAKVPAFVRVIGFLLGLSCFAAGLVCALMLLLAWRFLNPQVPGHLLVFVSGFLVVGFSPIASVQLAWLNAVNRLWWFAAEVAALSLFGSSLFINGNVFH